jgi:hypothetical protein
MASKKSKVKDEEGQVGSKDSGQDDWNGHEVKMREAMRKSAIVFMVDHVEQIKKASSEEAAYRSYVCGVIDALTVARNALGFWGVEEIRKEFERWNSMRVPKKAEPSQSSGDIRCAENGHEDQAVDMQRVQVAVAELAASRKKEGAGRCGDVMFA